MVAGDRPLVLQRILFERTAFMDKSDDPARERLTQQRHAADTLLERSEEEVHEP